MLALVIGSFAGYALAGLRFRGKFIMLAIILSITTFPPIAIAAPLFKFWTDLDIYDTLLGLVPPFLAFTLPLTIYVLASFFKEIPRDLSEAALVDGATHFQAFRKVVMPLAAPGLVTAGLLSFIWAWNEFLLAITLTSSPSARPVPPALAFFTGSREVRGAARHDHGGHRRRHGAARSARAGLPEAHRRRADRGEAVEAARTYRQPMIYSGDIWSSIPPPM